MLFIYNMLLIFLALILSPVFAYKIITDRRYRTGLSERLGIVPVVSGRPIWFHAASVGEVTASIRLIEKIRERWPDKKVLISTFTSTGNQAAREKFKADGVIFLPLDFPWMVNTVLNRLNPSILILMETELWPNLIIRAGKMRIPVVLVNGRISDRSYGKYWLISPLLRKMFENVSLFLMQSDGDAGRIAMLGAESSKVSVSGNIKFDVRIPIKDIPFMNDWKGTVFIAGSTHKGEDALILDILKELQGKYRDLMLVLAPRHLDRIREVEGLLKERGLHYVKRSEVSDRIEAPVLLLDTLGELASFFRYGTIIFMGGSFVPVGGHNLLEPAILGKPVLFGPYTHNFRDISQILIDSGGGVRVNNAEELTAWIDRLLSDGQLCSSMGSSARQAVLQNRGATERTLAKIAEIY